MYARKNMSQSLHNLITPPATTAMLMPLYYSRYELDRPNDQDQMWIDYLTHYPFDYLNNELTNWMKWLLCCKLTNLFLFSWIIHSRLNLIIINRKHAILFNTSGTALGETEIRRGVWGSIS